MPAPLNRVWVGIAAIAQQATSFDAESAYKQPLDWRPEWQPRTQAWTDYMDKRMAQIARIRNTQQRWDGYLVAMQQGVFVQNYTQRGWAVVDCPREIYHELLEAFHKGFNKSSYENTVDQILCERADGDTNSPCEGDRRAWFVNTGLNNKVLQELQPIHEEWSGVALQPSFAYGLRVYQNGSSLTMHTDVPQTHVVSSILHVDRDYGGQEPWPIVIEGVDGQIAEVDLQPGQMLFYESAKCTHGRPRTFRGNWYTSIFIHYRPVEYEVTMEELIDLVPESWRRVLEPLEGLPELTVFGTGFKEHGCPSGWCSLSAEWPPKGYVPEAGKERSPGEAAPPPNLGGSDSEEESAARAGAHRRGSEGFSDREL